VRNNVHANNVENSWSLLNLTLKSTYINVNPIYLNRYLDEQAFRFNERKDNESGSGQAPDLQRIYFLWRNIDKTLKEAQRTRKAQKTQWRG
jgi:hypothetical protein